MLQEASRNSFSRNGTREQQGTTRTEEKHPFFPRLNGESPASKGLQAFHILFDTAMVCRLLSYLIAARWSPPSRTRPCIVSSRSVFLSYACGAFFYTRRGYSHTASGAFFFKVYHCQRLPEKLFNEAVVREGPASGGTAE